MQDLGELARIHKKPISAIKASLEYAKRHPNDLLQPGDKKFDAIWGEKVKRDAKLKQRGQDEWKELEEKKAFQQRKTGMDKVHKRFTVV